MIVRYDPFEELRKMQEDFDRTFEGYWTNLRKHSALQSGKGAPLGEFVSPAIEVQALDNQYVVKADLPGIDKKDIHVNVDNDTVTIAAETSNSVEKGSQAKDNYYCERYYGSYYREIPLASPVDEEHVTATFENGVLTLELPRKAFSPNTSKEVAIK